MEVRAGGNEVFFDVAGAEGRGPANQRVPTAVIRSAAVEIFAIAELSRQRLLVFGLEKKLRFDNGCVFEADLARDDIVELRARIIAQCAEIAHLARGIDAQ